jgi:hypothetical protein
MIFSMLCSIGSAAAAPPLPAEPADATASVTVKAQRELRILSAQILKLQDQIYSDYNKVNTNREFDIVCTVEVPTDSHFKYRRCLPEFVHAAREGEALDFIQQTGAPGGHPARPASMVVLEKRDDFTRHFRTVIHSHPALLELDQKLGELQKDYEAALKQRRKGSSGDWLPTR